MAGKRKHNPHVPAHIDQSKLPKGVYWDNTGKGRWFIYTPNELAGRKTVAYRDAKLSDLHKVVEGQEISGLTFKKLGQVYMESQSFKELGASTKRDNKYCQREVENLPTKDRRTFGALEVKRLRAPHIQAVVDRFHNDGTPAKTNHILRYLRKLFTWAIARGKMDVNPASAVKQVKERKLQRLPTHRVFNAVLAYAYECAAKQSNQKGARQLYLPLGLELAYMLRLRGIEVTSITLDLATEDGIRTDRRKGSRNSFVPWTPRLRKVWADALKLRKERLGNRPEAIRKEDRFLFLTITGTPLTKSAFDTQWQRFITQAIAEGIIAEHERFAPHDLKRKGGTEAKGSKGDRQDALGVSDSVMKTYDKSVPIVPSTEAAFEGVHLLENLLEPQKK